MAQPNPFKWFKISREIIRLAVMMYVQFPFSLRDVEDLLHERGVKISTGPYASGGLGLASPTAITMVYLMEKVGSQAHPLRQMP